MVVFHAKCVSLDDQEDCWLVGFADDKFDTRDYLMLQRAFEDDEQDVSLGEDTYYVERNGQGWSGYGGIKTFELQRDRVKVSFTKEGADEVGGVTEMEITFQLDMEEFSELKDYLGKVFANTDCLIA